jgi:hypothetical protein
MSDRATRFTGVYAVIAAAAAVLLAPLLALSYFGTSEGAEDLEVGTVSAWADPARDLAGGLLTWASHDRVYATYIQAFALLFPAVFLCAWAVRARRRAESGRFERWSWRIALAGYGLASIGLSAAFVVLVGDPTGDGEALNFVFLALMFPGMLLSVIGSTVLGIALLRARYAPKLTAWLLALALPLMLVGSDVLGHNSLGMVPLFVAWAATGWQLSRVEPSHAHEPRTAATQ